MSVIQKLKSIQETFDKYIMASMYGEAGAPHLARGASEGSRTTTQIQAPQSPAKTQAGAASTQIKKRCRDFVDTDPAFRIISVHSGYLQRFVKNRTPVFK